ncbi:MAG: ArnT family glycosyltransferase [Flavobacteriales bacterium]
MFKRPSRDLTVLLLLWAGVTALDFGKAFHIDDTFYLMAAQWVEHHPLRPLSGMVNWGTALQPLYGGNQPPGFFYLVAVIGHFFGYSELPLQAIVSLFALLALFNFHGLAKHISPGSEMTATVLLLFCPAFLVNQNVMADIPMLALQIMAFRLLLVPGNTAVPWRYLFASLALSAAMFFKYSTAPLLIIFPLVLAFRREWRYLPLALLPFVLLVAWAIWNTYEFGFVHLLDRRGGDSSWRGLYVRTLSLFTCLGAISPFTPVYGRVMATSAGKWLFRAWLLAIGIFIALVISAWWNWLPEVVTDEVLRIAFTLNGLLFLLLAIWAMPRSFAPDPVNKWTMAAWGLSVLLFTALFAPGMATRYVLLAIPPLLLLLASALQAALRKEKVLAIATTAVLGVLLTISDREYAGFYRDMAPRIANEMGKGRTVWSAGHWGWQWYAAEAGMRTYSLHGEQPVAGDLMVLPQEYDAQFIAPSVKAIPLRTYDAPPSLRTFFNVERFAGMYTSSYGKLPWSLSRSHHKVIQVYQVVDHGGAPIVQVPLGD